MDLVTEIVQGHANEVLQGLDLPSIRLDAELLDHLLSLGSNHLPGARDDFQINPLNSLFIRMATPDFNFKDDATSGLFDYEAYSCLWDGKRTELFIRSIAKVVRELDRRFENYTIIDAGTGPVPVLALVAAAYSKNGSIIAIESNAKSFDMAREVINSQGFKARIKLVQGDAATVSIQASSPVRLIISETMNVGLAGEPMARIFANLKKAFPEAICIPHSVETWASLSSQEIIGVDAWGSIRDIKSAKFKYTSGQDLTAIDLSITSEGLNHPSYNSLKIHTRIKLDENGSKITHGQCSLTQPWMVPLSNGKTDFVLPAFQKTRLEINYKPGQDLDTVRANRVKL